MNDQKRRFRPRNQRSGFRPRNNNGQNSNGHFQILITFTKNIVGYGVISMPLLQLLLIWYHDTEFTPFYCKTGIKMKDSVRKYSVQKSNYFVYQYLLLNINIILQPMHLNLNEQFVCTCVLSRNGGLYKLTQKDHTPSVGIEPTTTRLRVVRSTD